MVAMLSTLRTNAAAESPDLVLHILRESVTALGAVGACFALRDAAQGDLRIRYALGPRGVERDIGEPGPGEEGPLRRAAEGKPVLLSSESAFLAQFSEARGWLADQQARAAAVLPVPGDSPTGAVAFFFPQPRAFSDHDLAIMQAMANVLARGVGQERHEEESTAFLHQVMHDLAGPITPILLQLEILRRSGLSLEQERHFDVLEHSMNRLNRLVHQVLDAARAHNVTLPCVKRPVDLKPLLEEAVATFTAAAEKAGVRVTAELDEELRIHADAERLMQVLVNLLSNAMKFTPRGGHVTVRGHRKDNWVIISVTDTGPGFSSDQGAQLFRPFMQPHPDSKKLGGSGLGLYISKALVEQHGGRIWATSAGPGKGATFAFSLPLTPPT